MELIDFLVPIKFPEIVVALVAPIGTDMSALRNTIEAELRRANYQTKIIKVTDLLKEFDGEFDLQETPEEARYDSYIKAGNKLRERMTRDDAFALLAIAAIAEQRFALTGSTGTPSHRTAYIVSQLKRPEEIRTLRKVYGRAFYQFSAFCPKDVRTRFLSNRIWESHGKEKAREKYIGTASDLIARDEAEDEDDSGQRVRDTFHLADFIVDATSEESLKSSCCRSIELAFGNPFITPTREEQGIFLARAAALRSADLSRQVGAVITDKAGEIISLGCNEVPKAHGGTYWEGDKPDWRDFKVGYDPSAKAKKELFHDTLRRLSEADWLRSDLSAEKIDDLVEKATKGSGAPLEDAHVGDVLEFGRVVHAEMNALLTAARKGNAVDGATMFVTTFPCHGCARHIIAAGVHRVVYLEPYSKSQTLELYDKETNAEGATSSHEKTTLEQFVGVAPLRYSDFFARGVRKSKSGKKMDWSLSDSSPAFERLVPSYTLIETAILTSLMKQLSTSALRLKKDSTMSAAFETAAPIKPS